VEEKARRQQIAGRWMVTVQFLALVVLLANYGAFLWSVFGVFRHVPEQSRIDYRLLQIFNVAMWTVSLWQFQEKDHAPFAALLVSEVLFGALFWWTVATIRRRPFSLAFSHDIPEFHVTGGPYRWIRHPFYTSYLGCYLSVAVVIQSPPTWLCALLVVAIYWRAARMEEAKFSRSSFAESYDSYRRRSGMFFPVTLTGYRPSV
jgi:protein-S-isoprenylcysteine O-methyltransferase Ste14